MPVLEYSLDNEPRRLEDWPAVADNISKVMTDCSAPSLDREGLALLARELHILSIAKRICEGVGTNPPAEMRKKLKAIKKASAALRCLLQDDMTGAASIVTKEAEALLEQNPTGLRGDAGIEIARILKWIGYQAPFARTNVLGDISFAPLAPLAHFETNLHALETAAQTEFDAQQKEGRGKRKKQFRQTVIGCHLPDLYSKVYPAGRKGTFDPMEGTLDGPLYRFVRLASEALGYGRPASSAIQQAIRRERASLPPQQAL